MTADEDPQDQEELALRDQVRLAGLVDQLRDLAHRLVHRQVLELREDHQAEREAEDAHEQAPLEQRAAGHAAEADLGEIRDLEVGLAAALMLGGGRRALGPRGVERRTGHRGQEDQGQEHREDPDGAPVRFVDSVHVQISSIDWGYERLPRCGNHSLMPIFEARVKPSAPACPEAESVVYPSIPCPTTSTASSTAAAPRATSGTSSRRTSCPSGSPTWTSPRRSR